MTSNQIAYFKVKVEQEHYKLSDAEAARHNKTTEQQTSQQLQEAARTNRANEAIKVAQLDETTRHNQVGEAQTWASLNIQQANLQESIRHNVAVEQETHRANYQNELLKASSNAIQRELNNSVIEKNKQEAIGKALENEFSYATQNARIIQTVMSPMNNQNKNSGVIGNISGALTSLASAVTTRTPTSSTVTISPKAVGIPTSVTNHLTSKTYSINDVRKQTSGKRTLKFT
jgi:hypothetical protein